MLTPIQASFGVHNETTRQKSENNFIIAYLPNMKVGEGWRAGRADLEMYVEGRTRRRKGDRKEPTSLAKLKNFHALLDIGFSSFLSCCK